MNLKVKKKHILLQKLLRQVLKGSEHYLSKTESNGPTLYLKS